MFDPNLCDSRLGDGRETVTVLRRATSRAFLLYPSALANDEPKVFAGSHAAHLSDSYLAEVISVAESKAVCLNFFVTVAINVAPEVKVPTLVVTCCAVVVNG